MILVGGLEHFFFFNILGVIIPLTNMFQRGRSTTNQDTVNLWKSMVSGFDFPNKTNPLGWGISLLLEETTFAMRLCCWSLYRQMGPSRISLWDLCKIYRVNMFTIEVDCDTLETSFNLTFLNPRCSMYGIFTNICRKKHLNVGKSTIHGASGNGFNMMLKQLTRKFQAFTIPSTWDPTWPNYQIKPVIHPVLCPH